ncbi:MULTISPECIES: hypothetical protein [unclassified Sphingomonas]|uniref:hypothetical protein n=1 Tax=unclassified Sphingomonas TaxID=196159 RepID=UPI002151379C|nr:MULTISPECIES: hypothetical protein [unclassified Sphingomonas]MCR5870594.1 hypothetical protein [Sphingomonas sp. J344]UUY01061.1 hypothetical protein LRS08_08465 [Sphingomonas sp. J315]
MHYLTGLVTALFVASPALAEDWDFVLINGTGKPIKTVELAPTGSTDWKPGLEEEGARREPVVKPGARTTVRLDRPSSQCRYDLRATFDDASTMVFSNANICDNSYVTVKLTGGKPSISAN